MPLQYVSRVNEWSNEKIYAGNLLPMLCVCNNGRLPLSLPSKVALTECLGCKSFLINHLFKLAFLQYVIELTQDNVKRF